MTLSGIEPATFLLVAQYPPPLVPKDYAFSPYSGVLRPLSFLTQCPLFPYRTVAPNFFYHRGISEIIFLCPEDSHSYENENKQKRHLDADGDYSSTANCRTKIPVLFQRKFSILRDSCRFLLIHLTILTEPLRVFCRTLLGKNCYRAVNRPV